MQRTSYSEGTWFAVPLKNGGFAVGVVARATQKGQIVLAYFFGPKRDSIPSLADVEILRASSAIKVLRAGDLHLISGKWRIIGCSTSFRRSDWPMPRFVRSEELSNRAFEVQYADDDPGQVIAEVRINFGTSTLERDSLSGAVSVEMKLTKLLG